MTTNEQYLRSLARTGAATLNAAGETISILARRGVSRVRAETRHRRQHATRGWSDRDTWNFDVSLCTFASACLQNLADHGLGFPAQGDYDTPEKWKAALRMRAGDLAAYATAVEHSAETNEVATAAQDALRWVADNLTILWD